MKLETKHLRVEAEVKKPLIKKEKLRKCAVFLLIPLHLIFYYAGFFSTQNVFLILCLILFAADMILSCTELRLFTAKRGRIGEFVHDFLPYLGKKALIAAVDYVIFLILDHTHTEAFGIIDTEELWLGICAAVMFLTAIVSFAAGAARTMLYHDKK